MLILIFSQATVAFFIKMSKVQYKIGKKEDFFF